MKFGRIWRKFREDGGPKMTKIPVSLGFGFDNQKSAKSKNFGRIFNNFSWIWAILPIKWTKFDWNFRHLSKISKITINYRQKPLIFKIFDIFFDIFVKFLTVKSMIFDHRKSKKSERLGKLKGQKFSTNALPCQPHLWLARISYRTPLI